MTWLDMSNQLRLTQPETNLIETIEEALDVDRTRGGNALDTQIVSIETDEGAIAPVGGVIVTVECHV
jgi:hypothetical protein